MTTCQICLAAMYIFWSYFSQCFFFVVFLKKSKVKNYKKKFKCSRPLKESSLKVATTRAELHKIQHKSIKLLLKESGWKTIFK